VQGAGEVRGALAQLIQPRAMGHHSSAGVRDGDGALRTHLNDAALGDAAPKRSVQDHAPAVERLPADCGRGLRAHSELLLLLLLLLPPPTPLTQSRSSCCRPAA